MTDVSAGTSIVRALKPLVPQAVRRQLRRVQSLSWLPNTPWGDRLWAINRFRITHQRFPRRGTWLYFDKLFQVRLHELTLPERIRVTDKEHLRSFVSERVGERYNVPAVAVLRSAEEAKAFAFPAECVIKPTHMSGEIIFNRRGHAVDRQRVAGWFSRNYYLESREANYRTLTPKVIVEPYVFGRVYPDIATDYKFYCIDGQPKMIKVFAGNQQHRDISLFTADWRLLPFLLGKPIGYAAYGDMPRPANLDEMNDLAARLSHGFSFVRVDLYSDGRQILLGEITNCGSGAIWSVFTPREGEILASKLMWPNRWPP